MATSLATSSHTTESTLPSLFLNAFELHLDSRNPWRVSLYSVTPLDDSSPEHEERGSIKNAVWRYKFSNPGHCSGPHSYVVDLDEGTVAVPSTWQIPTGATSEGYYINPIQDTTLSLDDPEHDAVVSRLLKAAFNRVLKNTIDSPLGPLWQHFNDFCQIPSISDDPEPYLFCRKIRIEAMALPSRRWCAQIRLSTQTVDGMTFAEHLDSNHAPTLAEWVELKRKNRFKRGNRPADVAVLRMHRPGGGPWTAEKLELANPEDVVAIYREPRKKQGGQPLSIQCLRFERGEIKPVAVTAEQLRLILDNQITQEDHRQTIIDPTLRSDIWRSVPNLLDKTIVFGAEVRVSDEPINVRDFPHGLIGPPAIRVRKGPSEDVIVSPDRTTYDALRGRGRERIHHLRKYGFLQTRPVNPLLACPSQRFSKDRANRLRDDLNGIAVDQQLPFSFPSPLRYREVDEIRQVVDAHDYTSAFIVLPEGRAGPTGSGSTHELVKQRVPIPTQCIHYDNTFFDRSGRYKSRGKAGRPLPTSVITKYSICLWSLAVKNHFVPFAPAEPFHYNVHVGIDVGGRDNNSAMICVGYGFEHPRERLVFRAEALPIQGAKAEPIPADALQHGIQNAFEHVAEAMAAGKRKFDLTHVLFLRDGSMLGDTRNGWNERDAFGPLLHTAKEKGWVIGKDPTWTVAEISKSAEGWRPVAIDSKSDSARNPLVGQWIAPFEDADRVLLSTTGSPYLTQGTANPILIAISQIVGEIRREQVIQDIVWEADMCFTKPDIGLRLPWVLHVANEGALQLSRSYEISGVPA